MTVVNINQRNTRSNIVNFNNQEKRGIMSKEQSDPYKLNLSHSRIVSTCMSIRNDEKNWVTEKADGYSISVFRKRVFRAFVLELMTAKGYKSVAARLRADEVVKVLKLNGYNTLLTILNGYVRDKEFRDLLNYNIDRDLERVEHILNYYVVEFRSKSLALDTNYTKVQEMEMTLTYLLDTLYEIRKYGLEYDNKIVINRGINSVLKDIGCKEYSGSYYFFHSWIKPTVRECRRTPLLRLLSEGSVYSVEPITNMGYNTLINLLTLKKMNKDLYNEVIELAMYDMSDYLYQSTKNFPLELYEMAIDIVVHDHENCCNFDSDCAMYKQGVSTYKRSIENA